MPCHRVIFHHVVSHNVVSNSPAQQPQVAQQRGAAGAAGAAAGQRGQRQWWGGLTERPDVPSIVRALQHLPTVRATAVGRHAVPGAVRGQVMDDRVIDLLTEDPQ